MHQNWKKFELQPCDIEFLQKNEDVFEKYSNINDAMIELIDRFRKENSWSLSWEAIFYFLSCDTDMWDHLEDSFIEACGESFNVSHTPKEIHNDKLTYLPCWFAAPELEVADFAAVENIAQGEFNVSSTFDPDCINLKKVILPQLKSTPPDYSMFFTDYNNHVDVFVPKEVRGKIRKNLIARNRHSAHPTVNINFIGI